MSKIAKVIGCPIPIIYKSMSHFWVNAWNVHANNAFKDVKHL